ncbi:helix-turn-helix domain-containing protein [Spongiimicrobium salis]|uniref:helix-turn-helix domain-containing protein n=1 Tax=Spongiimicrobium salis TaxID=1667022 RepID=UPI00374D8A8B
MHFFYFDDQKYGFELMMDLHRFESNPNTHFQPEVHTIDFYEIMILEESKGDVYLNDHGTSLKPLTLLFASPHQKKKNNIRDAKGFHLVFKSDFLADFFSDKLFVHRLHYFYNAVHPQFFQIRPEDYGLIKSCLHEIQEEIHQYKIDSKHIIRSLLYFVLSKLNRLYAVHYQISRDQYAHIEVYQFKEVLEKQIRNLQRVEAYTSILGTDRNRLNKLLKQYDGSTITQNIHQRLIQEIKTELLYTSKTISEIAHALNFSESNNLSRFFTQHEKMSPSQFRTKYKMI